MTDATVKKKPGRPKKQAAIPEVDTVSNEFTLDEFSGIKIIIRTFHDGTPLPDNLHDPNLWSVQAVEDYVGTWMKTGWRIGLIEKLESKVPGTLALMFVLEK